MEYTNRIFTWDFDSLKRFYEKYIVKWLNSVVNWTEAQKKQARANLGFGDGDIDDEPTAGSNNLVKSGGVLSTCNKIYSLTPLFDKDGNVVQKEDISVSNGVFIDNAGGFGYGASYAITDYIPIKSCKSLKWHGYLPVGSIVVSAIAFYDDEKTFISSISVGDASSDATYTDIKTDIETSDIPSNAVYIRCSTEVMFDVFFVWGENISFNVSNYIAKKIADEDEGNKILTNLLVDKNGNIVHKEDITTSNGIFIISNGQIGNNAAYAISDYIFIEGCNTLEWNGYLPAAKLPVAAIAFYNKRQGFISSISVGSDGTGATYTSAKTKIITNTIPPDAVYVRCSTEVGFTMFCLKGDILSVDSARNSVKPQEYNFDNTLKYSNLNFIKETAGLTSIIHDWGFIGDSLCSGEIAYTKEDSPSVLHYLDCYPFSYGQRIAKIINGKGVNYSNGGLTTRTWWQHYVVNQASGWQENGESSIFTSDIHSAYIIALGTNDANQGIPVGSISDINLSDYTQNADTFTGNYGKIIQKIRELNNRSAIFLIIYPNLIMPSTYDSIIKQITTLFTGVFIIDLRSDLSNAGVNISPYFYGGHLTTQGYQFMCWAIINEIDNIIRNNMSYFNKFALIGTSIQSDDIIW